MKPFYRVLTKTRRSQIFPNGKSFKTPAAARKYVAAKKNLTYAKIVKLPSGRLMRLRLRK